MHVFLLLAILFKKTFFFPFFFSPLHRVDVCNERQIDCIPSIIQLFPPLSSRLLPLSQRKEMSWEERDEEDFFFLPRDYFFFPFPLSKTQQKKTPFPLRPLRSNWILFFSSQILMEVSSQGNGLHKCILKRHSSFNHVIPGRRSLNWLLPPPHTQKKIVYTVYYIKYGKALVVVSLVQKIGSRQHGFTQLVPRPLFCLDARRRFSIPLRKEAPQVHGAVRVKWNFFFFEVCNVNFPDKRMVFFSWSYISITRDQFPKVCACMCTMWFLPLQCHGEIPGVIYILKISCVKWE